MSVRVEVDHAVCIGAANCEYWAPSTFEINDQNQSEVTDPEGDPIDKIERAVTGCPTRAISAWDGDTPIG